jgi:hypothetical protein
LEALQSTPEHAADKVKWCNTAYIAFTSLVSLKCANDFQRAVAEARHIGADLYSKAYTTRAFYDQTLSLFDLQETAQLKKDLAESPFPIYCFSCAFDENLGFFRAYFAGKDCTLKMRVLKTKKLYRINHDTQTAYLRGACEELGISLEQAGSWVADGCGVNGVMEDQNQWRDNTWAHLPRKYPPHVGWARRWLSQTKSQSRSARRSCADGHLYRGILAKPIRHESF